MEASSPRGWMLMPIEPREGARGGLGGSYTESISSNFFFKYTAYVCPMISRRGIVIVKIMNTSIIFTYEVVGRLSAIPMWLEEYHSLRYESSTLILYKELSSPIFQSCQSVCQACVTPFQISTFLTQYHQFPTATAS